MKENLVTWIMLGVIIWELEKQNSCACPSGPAVCTDEIMNTPSEPIPAWISALGGAG